MTRIRDKARLAVGALTAAMRVDSRVKRRGGCMLYSASDGNRGQRADDGYFSPILEPIQSHYRTRSYEAVNLAYPISHHRPEEIRSGAISVNRRALGILLIWMVERVVLGADRAARRKSGRRIELLTGLLGALQPKLIFAFQATPELCQAAHGLKISVIEPMHGMHLSPRDEIFRSTIVGVETPSLPDAYLAYDDQTAGTLRGLLGERPIGVFRVPHPAHVAVHDSTSPLSGDRAAAEKPGAGLTQILITLQWGYDGERASLANIIPNGVLHPAVEQAIMANPDVRWLLRLHPVQMRSRGYRKHREFVKALAGRCPNVEWQEATAQPLAQLLARVQGHITMTSGSAGEAAIFGVPSLMLCPTLKPNGAHHGWFAELVHEGSVEFGELDPDRISAWMRGVAARHAARRVDWAAEKAKLADALDQILEQYGRN